MSKIKRVKNCMTLADRRRLEKLLNEGVLIKEVVEKINFRRNTIHYERMRMGSLDIPYNAKIAHQDYLDKVGGKKARTLGREKEKTLRRVIKILTCFNSKRKHPEITECLDLLTHVLPDQWGYVSRLSIGQKEKIVELYNQGFSITRIAGIVGCARSSIGRVINKYKESIGEDNESDRTSEILKRWGNV